MMQRALLLLAGIVGCVSQPITATGYLMDVFCAKRDGLGQVSFDGFRLQVEPGKHTIHCLQDPAICVNSGYGLWIRADGGGYFMPYKFDARGNDLAYAWLASINRSLQPANALITVTGTLLNGRGSFAVSTLQGVQSAAITVGDPTTAADLDAPIATSTDPPTPLPTKEPTTAPTTEPTNAPTTQPTPPPTTQPETSTPGFNFGGDCNPGEDSFSKVLAIPKVTKDVGPIPTGTFDVEVELSAENDLDVVLYDLDDTSEFEEGRAVVQWCSSADHSNPDKNCGILGSSKSPEWTVYDKMNISYSGYNGGQTVDSRGEEWLRISGMTTRNLMMKVYSYKSGNATVSYSWGPGCGGVLKVSLTKDETAYVGEIPEGQDWLNIILEAPVVPETGTGADLDIQLYDKNDISQFPDKGAAIIAYCQPKQECNYGPLTQGDPIVSEYKGRLYDYSGWRGTNGNKGNEFVKVDGETNLDLDLYLFAYRTGTAKVYYTYNRDPALGIPDFEAKSF